jgi:hypothetical protein
MKLVTLVQVGGLSNTKKSVQPSTLATSTNINVYLLNGQSSFSDTDVEAVKVGLFQSNLNVNIAFINSLTFIHFMSN